MARLILSIGSNVDRENNIQQGIRSLSKLFGDLHCSSIYESDAAGFTGERFYNLVAVVYTSMDLVTVNSCLKELEVRFGRDLGAPKYSSKTLDIDILCFDDLAGEFSGVELPRAEILHSSYVLYPLAELLPDVFHPVVNQSYQELAKQFSGAEHGIKKIDGSAFRLAS